MLYQVFYNLIENAVKFTNADGIITISINKDNNKFDFFIKQRAFALKRSFFYEKTHKKGIIYVNN